MRKHTMTQGSRMVLIVLALLLAVGGFAVAGGGRRQSQAPYDGYGMMGRTGGYRGHHGGMMGGHHGGYSQGYRSGVTGERISGQQAQAAVQDALSYLGNDDLEIAEIMEFERNYYAQIRERGSEVYAFELLIDPYSGEVYPEPGPNMMWNTEYGHMGRRWFRGIGGERVDAAAAVSIASDWVQQQSASATVGDVEAFPGYYTLHVYEDGAITGMLSVHARSGDVWYHDWHGPFVAMVVGHE